LKALAGTQPAKKRVFFTVSKASCLVGMKLQRRVGVAGQRRPQHGGERQQVVVATALRERHALAAQLLRQHRLLREKVRGALALRQPQRSPPQVNGQASLKRGIACVAAEQVPRERLPNRDQMPCSACQIGSSVSYQRMPIRDQMPCSACQRGPGITLVSVGCVVETAGEPGPDPMYGCQAWTKCPILHANRARRPIGFSGLCH
jgi:hypothetical protein